MTKKKSLPAWAGCLLLVALTVIGTLRFWQPITEESGAEYTLRLERVYRSGSILCLDFGKDDDFRLPKGFECAALHDADALGREYRIIADYHAQRRGSDYYDVYALIGMDGTEYLTIEQSEANRVAMLPTRVALLVTLNAAVCALLIWADIRKKKALEATENMPEASAGEEDSTYEEEGDFS